MTCTWDADFTGIQEQWDKLSPEVQARALLLATSSLQMLTLNRVGTCPVTIRPCPVKRPCAADWEPYRMYDSVGGLLHGGDWLNPCGCRTAHWCAPLSEVDLPGPVGYIDRLKIDGVSVPLDDGNWRLDNGHLLVWQGAGPSPIPSSQDLNKPDSEPGTWSITYTQSYPVAADGRIAVAWLAMEFARAFKPAGKCELPRGVTNVVRSGVTFTIDAGLFPNGLTGMDTVDAFILKWVPPGAPSRSATVFSPRNRGRGPRTTSTLRTRDIVNPHPAIGEGGFGL